MRHDKDVVKRKGSNLYVGNDVYCCYSEEVAAQAEEILVSGGSIIDIGIDEGEESLRTIEVDLPRLKLMKQIDVASISEDEADEYLVSLWSLLDAETQQERDEIIAHATSSHPGLAEFVVIAIKHAGLENAPALIAEIKERLPELFDELLELLLVA